MHVLFALADDRPGQQISGMLRKFESMALGIAVVLVSAGLVLVSVPATRVEITSVEVPLAADFDCPYAELLVLTDATE
jgi:hypothetical protein